MIQANYKKVVSRLKAYLKDNWGAPFIMVFFFVLLGVAISISAGLRYDVNTIIVYSLYSLIIGVALQVVRTFKQKESKMFEAI